MHLLILFSPDCHEASIIVLIVFYNEQHSVIFYLMLFLYRYDFFWESTFIEKHVKVPPRRDSVRAHMYTDWILRFLSRVFEGVEQDN